MKVAFVALIIAVVALTANGKICKLWVIFIRVISLNMSLGLISKLNELFDPE